ncbi:MAG: type VI secretion system tube protein TssD [Planctomycetota bacterium]|jgi:type VI secretion system secreted protein Hcp
METGKVETKVILSVLALHALVLFSLSGYARGAAYIKFDGVDGESQDKDHKGWSDVLSFNQGHFLADPSRTRDSVVSKPIEITKELDKAGPKLAEAVCTTKVFPKVEIHLTASYTDAGRVTYLAYELTNALIVSYNISGSGQSEDVPTEILALEYEEIKCTYTERDPTGGSLGNVEYSHKTVVFCGYAGHPCPVGDVNRDCKVNFLDIAMVGAHWLEDAGL